MIIKLLPVQYLHKIAAKETYMIK